MIKSMTGFGRSEVAQADRKVTVEIKSVNNRYLDVSMKMPRQFNSMEAQIRAELKKYLQRGKVDIYISYQDLSSTDVAVKYNKSVAAEYVEFLRKMGEDFNLDNDIRVSSLARLPEIFTTEDVSADETELWGLVQSAIDGAAEKLMETRTREGEFLRKDLLSKLDGMDQCVDFISEKAPEIVKSYQDKLHAKVEELLGTFNMDENRILQEVTIYADKICVDEELVRLRSHIQATRLILEEKSADGKPLQMDEGVGRKLDFLAQEMNRESNTILSKTDDLEVSNRGIELKTTIEKVREQIQNIE